MEFSESFEVIESHTAGEPTRVIVGGLAEFSLARDISQQLDLLRTQFDWVRTSIILEPRGSDVMVGALLLPPQLPDAVAAVIFFNNVGYLGMCGHGMIGVITTLGFLGRLGKGTHLIETPVGVVQCELADDGSVLLQNVPSYRWRHQVPISLSDGTLVHGDIAWGGNWFYICGDHGIEVERTNIGRLTSVAEEIRELLDRDCIRGENEGVIDHIELVSGQSRRNDEFSNFVLCPGLAYDRSPCGTGTSAKVACLAADGKLKAGEWVRVRGITGESFEACYQNSDPTLDEGRSENQKTAKHMVRPIIRGRAFVNAKTQIFIDSADPFRFGIT